jgi:hypothetical protein
LGRSLQLALSEWHSSFYASPSCSAAFTAALFLPNIPAGRWRINPITHQPELLSSPAQQLLRLLTSAAATAALLLVAAALLLLCLNLQGYIPPHHGWLYSRGLAALSAPGGVFSKSSGAILSQVCCDEGCASLSWCKLLVGLCVGVCMMLFGRSRGLAALSAPGGLFRKGSGAILSQVCSAEGCVQVHLTHCVWECASDAVELW